MSTVLDATARLAVEHDRTAFNLAVWDQLVADPQLARLPYRIETDEHGQMIMSPPPAPSHGNKQIKIGRLLWDLQGRGEVISECPVSTSKGVKAIDVAWCSDEVWKASEGRSCLVRAPEICVEILSPSNTSSEIVEKKALCFEAGAEEFWICEENGTMRYFGKARPEAPRLSSSLCPGFPSLMI